MKANVTPQFFAENSVQELSEMSDYELNMQGRLASPVVLRKANLTTLQSRGRRPLR